MSDVGLFSRAKCLQQPAAAKVGEKIEVNYFDHDESHGELDSDIEYVFKDSNSRSA